MANTPKSREDLNLALGVIEYEMLIMATALILRQETKLQSDHHFRDPLVELACDSIRSKARSLMEFLTSTSSTHDDIQVRDFGLAAGPWESKLHERVSKYASHLSYQRAVDVLPKNDDLFEHAKRLLRRTAEVCEQLYAKGFMLTIERHTMRHERLVEQLWKLGISYRS